MGEVGLVLKRWAELDPDGAYEYVSDPANFDPNTMDRLVLLDAIAAHDPADLFHRIQQADDSIRIPGGSVSLMTWAKRDSAAAYRAVMGTAPDDQARFLGILIAACSRDDPDQVLSIACSLPWTPEFSKVVRHGWKTAGRELPKETLEAWRETSFPDEATRKEILGLVVESAEGDAEVLREFAASLEDPALRAELAGAGLRYANPSEIADGIDQILDHPDAAKRGELLAAALPGLFRDNPATAINVMEAGVPPNLRQGLIAEFLPGRYSKSGLEVPVETLLPLVRQLPMKEKFAESFAGVSRAIAAQQGVDQALDWVNSLTPAVKPLATAGVVSIWAETDSRAAARYVTSIADGATQGEAASAFLDKTFPDDAWPRERLDGWRASLSKEARDRTEGYFSE
ncbi:MAG: hypothetical protein R3F19_03635 [Verrucomicrobiales bacterium]